METFINNWQSTAEVDRQTEWTPADGMALIDQVGALLAKLSFAFDNCAVAAILKPAGHQVMDFQMHMVGLEGGSNERLAALQAAIAARSQQGAQ
jgi:hypothetical protein